LSINWLQALGLFDTFLFKLSNHLISGSGAAELNGSDAAEDDLLLDFLEGPKRQNAKKAASEFMTKYFGPKFWTKCSFYWRNNE
jgi:hypothetical protein